MYRKLHPKRLWGKLSPHFQRPTNVYFISGMCYDCSVFDKLNLPKNYRKRYIEWLIPDLEESLEDYTLRMAASIDHKKKFILVGYSFGGIIVQEIARILEPEKLIIISSIKNERETPKLFQMARKVSFADMLPMRIYHSSNFMLNLFNRYVYKIPSKSLGDFMTVTDPVYIRWSLRQIINWIPKKLESKIYHIHGTRDQVFPFNQLTDVIGVRAADHLMIIKRTKELNNILTDILAEK